MNSKCGLSKTFFDGTVLLSTGEENVNANVARIMYGKETTEKMLPWQVKLLGPRGCGASLVSMQVGSTKMIKLNLTLFYRQLYQQHTALSIPPPDNGRFQPDI